MGNKTQTKLRPCSHFQLKKFLPYAQIAALNCKHKYLIDMNLLYSEL